MAMSFSVAKAALDVKDTEVIGYDDSELDSKSILYIHARPSESFGHRCPKCGCECPKYDHGPKNPRKWRANDWGALQVFVLYRPWRVECPEHGVITEAVPWAKHKARFTSNFEKLVLWMAMLLPFTAVAAYLRIDWSSIDGCIERFLAGTLDMTDKSRFDGLVHIIIDETSYRKGHKYITVVLDALTNRVVWVGDGHGYNVICQFFKLLTPEQLASIKTVSGDGAKWIDGIVRDFVPHAKRCVDPFHVVLWISAALDKVRLRVARELKKLGDPKEAKLVKGAQIALGKDPSNLSDKQKARVDRIEQNHPELFLAYELKEALRRIFTLKGDPEAGKKALDAWYTRVKESNIPEFQEIIPKIKRHEKNICNSLQYGGNSARIEAMNNNIKLIIRRSYGFRNVERLINLVKFRCSGLSIELPFRTHKVEAA